MKYSLLATEANNNEERLLGENKNYNLLVDYYPEAYVEDQFLPNLKLSFFWFIRKTSALVLVERNQESPLSNVNSGINNVTIKIAQSITNDIVKKVTHDSEKRIDFDDDLDFEIFGIQEDHSDLEKSHSPRKGDTRSSYDTCQLSGQKPSRIRKPSEIEDDPKGFKYNTSYNSYTPNTASNSSMSGSTKFIGTKSKLTTKSQVYKGNSSKSSAGFNTEVLHRLGQPNQNFYNQGNAMSVISSEGYSQNKTSSPQPAPPKHNQHQSSKFGAFNTSYFMDSHNPTKSKSHQLSLEHRFSSDTKIQHAGGFNLFGGEGIEEMVDTSETNLASEGDDEHSSGIAKNLVAGVLDEVESPQHYKHQIVSKIDTNPQPEREYDYGSVSSGSEKDDENQIQVYSSNKSPQISSATIKHMTNSKILRHDFPGVSHALKKEGVNYNSSKLVPSSNFESIFLDKSGRISPEKQHENPLSVNMMHPMYSTTQNQMSGPFVSKGGVYPSNQGYSPTYPHMQMNTPENYYHYSQNPPNNMQQYHMYQGNPMYPPQYMPRTSGMAHPMKANSATLLMKPNSFSSKDISFHNMPKQMMQVHTTTEGDIYNRHISYGLGAPGLSKNAQYQPDTNVRLVRGKQYSNPVLSNQIQSLHTHMSMRQPDNNSMKPIQSVQENSVQQQAELQQPNSVCQNLAVPQPISQRKHLTEEVKVDPSNQIAKANPPKKAKSKKAKKPEKKKEKMSGRLKFFDEVKNYGFFLLDSNSQDMFVHYDDLKKTPIEKSLLASSKNRYSMRFTFLVFGYDGKNKPSKKATGIELVSIRKIDPKDNSEIEFPVFEAKDHDKSLPITEELLSNFFNSTPSSPS